MRNATQPGQKTLKNGNPRGDPNNAPRCLAKTRKGTPCMAPRVRGKKRCRMHGAFAGRPKDPLRQLILYNQVVSKHFNKFCINCRLQSEDRYRIHTGDCLPENFERRVQKYCHAFNQMKLSVRT
jgi:hypothetical protein